MFLDSGISFTDATSVIYALVLSVCAYLALEMRAALQMKRATLKGHCRPSARSNPIQSTHSTTPFSNEVTK